MGEAEARGGVRPLASARLGVLDGWDFAVLLTGDGDARPVLCEALDVGLGVALALPLADSVWPNLDTVADRVALQTALLEAGFLEAGLLEAGLLEPGFPGAAAPACTVAARADTGTLNIR